MRALPVKSLGSCRIGVNARPVWHNVRFSSTKRQAVDIAGQYTWSGCSLKPWKRMLPTDAELINANAEHALYLEEVAVTTAPKTLPAFLRVSHLAAPAPCSQQCHHSAAVHSHPLPPSNRLLPVPSDPHSPHVMKWSPRHISTPRDIKSCHLRRSWRHRVTS